MKCTVRQLTLVAPVLLLAAFPAQAQDPATIAFSPMNIEFMSGPIAFDNEPVAGAPYSAEAVTEVVQTLADGNRIVRESKAQINRDSKGRTRREQGLAMLGPLVGGPNGSHEMRHVQISDPETRTTIMLDLESRIAHKMPAPQFMFTNKTEGLKTSGKASTSATSRWRFLPRLPARAAPACRCSARGV